MQYNLIMKFDFVFFFFNIFTGRVFLFVAIGITTCHWYTTKRSITNLRALTSITRWLNTQRTYSSEILYLCLTRKCIKMILSRWITLKYTSPKHICFFTVYNIYIVHVKDRFNDSFFKKKLFSCIPIAYIRIIRSSKCFNNCNNLYLNKCILYLLKGIILHYYNNIESRLVNYHSYLKAHFKRMIKC